MVSVVDLKNEISPGTKNIPLAKVTITGCKKGSADICIIITQLDDHTGRQISPLIQSGEVLVDTDTVQLHPLPIVTENEDISPMDQEIYDTESGIKNELIDASDIHLPQLQFNKSEEKVVVEGELSPGTITTINGKEFTIPSGSIIYHDKFRITTVFDPSGIQLFTAEDSKAKEVWTPGSLKPATHVHEVPSGSFTNTQRNMTIIIDQKKVILIIIDEEFSNEPDTELIIKSAPPDWPFGYIEGIEYTPTQDLKKFSSYWTVPVEPSETELYNVVCMWNGLHRTTLYQGVIQPVVTWNENGDNYFKGRVWQVTNSTVLKSSAISTHPGHNVSGTLTWDEELEYWKIVLWDHDNYEAVSMYSNIVPNTDCQATLMLESTFRRPSDYLFGYVIFRNITLQSMAGTDITPPIGLINVNISTDWITTCPWLDIYTNGWPSSVLFRTGNSEPAPFPGQSDPPTDPDADYFVEDINGNGRLDFNDIVMYFNYFEWIKPNEPIDCFDYNKNTRIDFNDIVQLFNEL